MLGLEGRKDVVGRKAGGGEVNMTPWFIVLSCHRAARIRSFFSFFFAPFLFCKGEEGMGGGAQSLMLLWLPHQPSPYKG